MTYDDFVLPEELIPSYAKDKPHAIETVKLRVYQATLGTPPYREVGGRLRMRSLFFEAENIDLSLDPYFYPIWTLKSQPKRLNPGHKWVNKYPQGYIPAFREAYMAISDPTEYEVGVQLLGDYAHWQKLTEANWFQPYLEALRAELRLKLESEAIRQVRLTMASMQGTAALQAARWLAERTNPQTKRGRPSKAEVARAIKEEAREGREINEDAERLGL